MVKRKRKTNKKQKGKDLFGNTIEVAPVEFFNEKRKSFIANYLDPSSETYSNAYRSAINAGFEHEYAKNILRDRPKWLSEILGNNEIIDVAIGNLKKHLNLKTEVPVMTAFGPYIDKKTKKMLYKESPSLLKLQQDASFFALEKLHSDFKKKEKFEIPPGSKVDIKQIFILNPNGQSIPYNQANTEAISCLPKTA